MKLAWISHIVPFPPTNGAAQRSYHLLKHLAERHDVTLFALHRQALHESTSSLASAVQALSAFCREVRVFRPFSQRSRLAQLGSAALGIAGRSPYDVVWLRTPDLRERVRDLLMQRRVDLLHIDTVGLWPAVPLLPGVPIVLNHHNVESNLVEQRASWDRSSWRGTVFRREARKLRALEMKAASGVTCNVVVSQEDAERLREIAPEARIHIVENGIDPQFYDPGETVETDGSLLFIGTLGWFPNASAVSLLVSDIWPKLADKAGRRLVLVGAGAPKVAKDAAARDPRIHLTGFVPDVRPHLARASVYLCPIGIGGGTRLKVLEALAMKKPLVATFKAVEGLGLVDGKHYLRAESPADFVRCIEFLETNPAMAARLGNKGRELVMDRFGSQVAAGRLGNVYEAALREPRSTRS